MLKMMKEWLRSILPKFILEAYIEAETGAQFLFSLCAMRYPFFFLLTLLFFFTRVTKIHRYIDR